MKFLRVLTNALISGLFFSLLLALLLADLNINLPFKPFVLIKLTFYLMLTYGLLASFICLLVTYIHRFFTANQSLMDFVSASFLTLSFSLLILLFLVVFRENYAYFLSFFSPGLQFALRLQIMAFFVLAVAGLVLHYRHHHRKPRLRNFTYFFAAFGVVLIFAFWQRANYPPPLKAYKLSTLEPKKIDKKVTVLCLEGISLDFVLRLANERKLPNFSWLMDGGCWGSLEGFTPSDPFVLNQSFNTGKWPGKHRLVSEVRYEIPGIRENLEVVPRFILFRQLRRIGLLKVLRNEAPPVTKDIWKILEDFGAGTLKIEGRALGSPLARGLYPRASTAEVDPQAKPGAPAAGDRPAPASALDKPNPKADKLFATFFKDFQYETSWAFGRVKQAFFRDAEAEDRAFQLRSSSQPQLFSLLLDGADIAEMYFYKYNVPGAFGDIRQEEIQKYGSVIEKYYQFYDQIVGKYLASLKEDELFIVYSSFGAEPLPFWKRFVEWILGNAAVSAYHEEAPDGVLFIKGKGIVRGKNIDRIRLVDIAPTILYYFGLPVGKDMDGIVRGSLFDREFADENPIFKISSYEDVAVKK